MSGKFYNLDTSTLLGGETASDFYVASQKAVKAYVDAQIATIVDTNTTLLTELTDVSISSVANGQSLVYDSSKGKWVNQAINVSGATWGKITGSITAQTDLTQALSAKANASHSHTKSEITDFPTLLSSFTDDLGSSPTHTHSQYLTEHQSLDGKQDKITSDNKLSSDLVTDSGKTNKFVTTSEKNTWNGKQDAISDLETIRSLATSALQSGDNVSSLTNDAGYLTSSDISSVLVYKGTKASQSALPTTGNKKGDVWTVTDTGAEYVWDGSAWQYLGQILDLSGYQTKITSTNKLAASLIATTTDAQFVSNSEKTTWSGKQDAITDLETIRTNATAGKGAADTIASYGDIVTHNASEFQEAGDYAAATHTHTKSQITDFPTIGNGGVTIKKNGTAVGSFTMNQTGATSIDLTIPTTYSDVNAASSAHTHSYSDVGAASASHTHNYVPTSRKINGKTLTADVTLSSSDIGDLNTTISSAISGKANSSETYTKSEIDGKLTGAMHFKGTKPSEAALPTTGNTTGDMWNVESTGANYAWDGTAWDKLSENIDLSGVVPITRKINGKTLNADITLTYGDVGAASSAHTHSYSDVGAASASHTHNYVPTSRKVNGKTLSADITLTYSDVSAASAGHTHTYSYSDVGAASAAHTHTYSDVGAASSAHTHTYSDVGAASSAHKHVSSDVTALTGYTIATQAASIAATDSLNTALGKLQKSIDGKQASGNYVPTSRKINNKTLNADITLTYSDVSAASAGHTHTYSDVGAASSSHTHTYSDVGAASSGHTHSNYVPTTRTINGKTLNADVTLTYSDVSALSAGTTIPTVYNSGVTIKRNGTAIGSFTLNKTSATNIDITVPTTYTDVNAASASHTHTKSEITDFPTIPTVNATNITIQRNGTAIGTINTNQSTASAINISVPTTYTDVSAASSGHTHSNYVPTSRKVNGKTLNADITLTYSDVSAASATHTHTYSDVGAASAAHTHTYNYTDVGAASENHTHSYTDVGAASTAHKHTKSDITDFPTIPTVNNSGVTIKKNGTAIGSFTLNQTSAANIDIAVPTTYTDVNAASASHTHSNYVPTSRTINGKTLSANVTLSYSDVGALSASTTIPTVNNGSLIIKKNGTAAGTFTANQTGTVNVDLSIPTTYSDVNAASASHTHTYSDVGAASASHTHSYVPTSRKINGKTLSADITLATADISGLSTALSGKANSTETYTKSEIDGKLSGAMHFKGTVASASALPTQSNTQGDMYNVTDTGANYAWDGTAWDKLSENVDLSGLVPNTRKVNGKTLNADITLTYSDVSAASSGHTHTYSDVGAASASHTHSYVPTSRKVNGKTLNADITLTYSDVSAASSSHTHTYSDVGAASASHTHTYSDVGAASSSHTHSNYSTTGHKHTTADVTALTSYTIATQAAAIAATDSLNVALGKLQKSIDGKQASGSYVPTTRKINNKTLSADITLTYSDVSAASAGHTHTYSDVGAASSSHTHSYSDVGAASSSHTHSNYVPTTRTVNGKTLNANISLTYSDVSAASATHTHTYSDVGAASASHTHSYTYSDVGAASASHTHAYEPTSTAVRHTASTAVGSTIKPVYIASDGAATALTATVGSTIKPVYMNAGAITALGYTIEKSVPSNAVFTDTNNAVTNTLNTTTKGYITGTTNSATNTGGQIFDTGVYLTTTAGKLNATKMSLGTENVTMQYNSTTQAVEFVFA